MTHSESKQTKNKRLPKSGKPKMNLPARLLFLSLFYGSAIFFLVQADYVLAASLMIAGAASFAGYRAGTVYIVGSLVGFAVAIAVAPRLGISQEYRFEQWFGTTGLTNRLLSIGTVGILVSFFASMVIFVVGGLFLANRPRLDAINRWLGFVMGGVQGAFAVLLFLGGLLILEPIEKQRADTRDPLDLRGQFVSKWILKISDGVHASRIGPFVVDYNPFTRIPQLNKVEEVQQSVQVLRNPREMEALIRHPRIKTLAKRPEMKTLIRELTNDPEIERILKSGQPLDGEAAMTLMNHPAVLQLIDQPDFIEEAYKIIQQAGKEMPESPDDSPQPNLESDSDSEKTESESQTGEVGLNPFFGDSSVESP